MKPSLVTLVGIMILKDTATFPVLQFPYSVFGKTSLSAVAFTYVKVKPAKCLCLTLGLLPVVLILILVVRIWSCLHHS